MDKIDWSETECKFALVNNDRGIVEFFECRPSASNCEECWMVNTSETLYLKNAWLLKESPQPTLTYTQDMADNGELPSVGVEFVFCDSTNTKNNAVVTYVSEWNIVFKCLDDGFSKDVELAKEISGLNIARQILPIDTRTDEEKAFDKFLDDNYNSTKEEFTKSQSDRDFIEGLWLAFNCGWAAQPLTVKG